MKNNPLVQAIVVAVIAGALSGLIAAKLTSKTEVIQAGSATGSTFNSAKVAMINASFASATSSGVYNSDASDRIITDATWSCTGVGTSQTAYTGAGLATWTISMATSSTASGSSFLNANTNYVVTTVQATSAAEVYIASTTPGLTGSVFVRRWAAGTYLNIFTNATNTAACTIGVKYLAS